MYKGNKQRHFKGHALYGVTEGARCKKTSRAILAWPDMPLCIEVTTRNDMKHERDQVVSCENLSSRFFALHSLLSSSVTSFYLYLYLNIKKEKFLSTYFFSLVSPD
jgi:hypothetical protein